MRLLRITSCLAVAAALLPLALTSGCTDLSEIPEGVCGNAVVDAGEDCDGFAVLDGEAVEDGACIPPGQPNACRFRCQQGADAPACPAGFGCSAGGVCSRPTGRLVAQQELDTELVDTIQVADFDGDGIDDALIVHPTSTSVHFHDGSGNLASLFKVSANPGIPSVGDLTSDGLPDFVLPFTTRPEGLGVYEARAGGVFLPVSYAATSQPQFENSSFAIVDALRPTSGRDAQVTTEEVVFFQPSNGRLYGLSVDDNQQLEMARLLVDVGAEAGDVGAPIGGIASGSPAPGRCDSVALTFPGESRVFLAPTCDGLNWNTAGDRTWLQMPANRTPETRAFFVERSVEVTAGTATQVAIVRDIIVGSGPGLFIAYARPDGTYWSEPEAGTENTFSVLGTDVLGPFDEFLAVGRITDDECPDVVTTNGVFYGTPGGAMLRCDFVRIYPVDDRTLPGWDEAAIADMNNDGRLDIVAASTGAFKLDFFNGAASGGLNRFEVATAGAPSNLVLGDFDGDNVTDVAFTRAAGDEDVTNDAGEETSVFFDAVDIAFGQPAGAPAVPVTVAELPSVTNFVAGDYISNADNMDDLLALVVDLDGDQDTGRLVAPFIGRTDRQLQSPLRFPARGPLRAAVGDFDGDANGDGDLAVLLEPGGKEDDASLEVRFINVSGTAVIDDESLQPSAPTIRLDATFQEEGALLMPLDLEGDGVDELLILGQTLDAEGTRRGYVDIARLNGDVFELDGGQSLDEVFLFEPIFRRAEILIESGLAAIEGTPSPDAVESVLQTVDLSSARAELKDIDDDGDLDLAVTVIKDLQARLIIFPGTGSGFDVAGRYLVEIPWRLRSFTLMNLDSDPQLEVLTAVSPASGGANTFVAAEISFIAWDVDLAGQAVTEIPKPTLGGAAADEEEGDDDDSLFDETFESQVVHLASGDFNGDGVDDVMVGLEVATDVYLGGTL